MAKDNGRLRGTHFYKAKGLKGIVIRIPKDTKMRLKLLAVKLDVPTNEAVAMVLDHFIGNKSEYDLHKSLGNNTLVEVTVFVKPDAHQELRVQGIYEEQPMKDLAGRIVYQYLSNHTKIRLK